MTLEEHDETDSLLDELEAAERRDAASLPSDAQMSNELESDMAMVMNLESFGIDGVGPGPGPQSRKQP